MADKVDPRTGELTTANFGWVKPTVGASVDAWGGYINADLDGIDSTVHSIQTSVPAASTTTPAMNGTAAVGVGATFARADHVHPTDTSRYAATNPAGYITSASVPVASSTPPLMNGIAAVGTGTTWARADHVHPSDVAAMNDNRLINGDMRIDARNNGASGTGNNNYAVDRWYYYSGLSAKGTWGRNLNAVTGPVGFPYCLGFQSSSAYTPVTNDAFQFAQAIEADMIGDLAWGIANAQSVTLSFWVRSSLTGTFSGAIGNYAYTRAYPFSFSLPTANTWTKITVTIPGDTAGTWVMTGNAGSAVVQFDLGAGPANRGPANAWASAGYGGVTGSVSVVATNAATFYLTGVKLEIGSVATPYNRQSLAKSMADCQRYYQTSTPYVVGYNNAGGAIFLSRSLPVQMRAVPTAVFSGITYSNASGLVLNTGYVDTVLLNAVVTATANGSANANMTLSAEL